MVYVLRSLFDTFPNSSNLVASPILSTSMYDRSPDSCNSLTTRCAQDIMDTDLFWTKYLVRANQDMLFSCFIDQPKSSPTNSMYVKGLVMGTLPYLPYRIILLTMRLMLDHGYAVLKALEFRGKRFVKLRNPWCAFWSLFARAALVLIALGRMQGKERVERSMERWLRRMEWRVVRSTQGTRSQFRRKTPSMGHVLSLANPVSRTMEYS